VPFSGSIKEEGGPEDAEFFYVQRFFQEREGRGVDPYFLGLKESFF
jgi:hypothetical protein